MTARLRQWLEETHSDTFELVRHFLARFFDTEIGASAGDWHKLAIGAFATLVSLGLLGLQVYQARFRILQDDAFSTRQLYHATVRADFLGLLAITMALTALLTLLQWQSLFPSLRDYMALTGFPVSARQIFAAKFGALVLVFAAYAISLTGPLAGFFGWVIRGNWQENPSGTVLTAATFAALAGASAFVFFALLALQGVLLNFVPGRWFLRVSLFVQAALFIATVGALPLLGRQPLSAAWWPPVWFVWLWDALVTGHASARPALLAVVLPALLAILSYLLSYHRYRKLLLEAPPAHTGGHSGLGSRLLEWWIPNPREQAAFAFTWKTLARSRIHRLILLAYAGLALGWVVEAALAAPPVALHDEGMFGLMAVASPLGLAVLMILALRYLFTLPVTLRANWMFQTADQEGRAAWLTAVQRFVIACGIVPVYLAGLPASVAILGWLRALAVTALGALVALLCFERLFRNWCKLPFTCSYLPGKVMVWMLLFRASVGMVYFAAIPPLLLSASGELASFIALFTGLFLLWRRWRRIRLAQWAENSLLWEEAPEAEVQALHLGPLEQDASLTTATSQPAPEMFSAGMVASRGLLPQAWEEEIAEERSHPGVLLATFWEDVRYGCRVIRRNPLLSLVVVLTLTVGIGINASIFTVVNGMMLRPHIYKDPDSFVRVVPESRLQGVPRQVSYQEYLHLRDSTRTVRQLAAFSYFPVLIGDDDPGGSIGIAVSCNFFRVDGLDRAIVGRLIDGGDCAAPGQAPVAVIAEKVWHQRFASDPHIVGRITHVNNRAVTIVGVAPDLTTGWLTPPNIWLPYTAQPYMDSSRNAFSDSALLWLTLAGRLAPGFSARQVRAEFDILERQEDLLHPGRATAVTTTDGSWLSEFELYSSARDLFLLAFFMGSFTLVLLIACANVATLLLSRAASRRREIAVRLSLGAPRIRLVRMLITESLVMAALAGTASAWLVRHVPHPLFRYLAPRAPEYPMDPDWRIFLYISAIVLLSGLLSGLAPALESVKVELASSLKGYGSLLRGGGRLRATLVTAQVAMSMVLLVGAGLFAKSEERNLHADPGYLPQKVVVSQLRFPENTPVAAARVRLDAIAQRMKALPGVHSVAFSDELPMIFRATVELRPPERADAVQAVDVYTGSPGFFETVGVPILRGREFQNGDGPAIVVSRLLARTFWPKSDPLGKTLTVNGFSATVVGVAKDVDPVRFGGSENPPLYLMRGAHPNRNILIVRFDSDPKAGAFAVRSALREYDPGMFVVARVLQSWIDQVTEVLWNVVSLIVLLGLVATVLATTGIYGAVSFAVNQRTRDLGIRLALGATRSDIVREVFVSGGRPVLRGLFIGLWLSVALAASLRQNMKGTPLRLDSSDPLLYGGAALLLAAAAALAMSGPARRGSNSNPLDALRCD